MKSDDGPKRAYKESARASRIARRNSEHFAALQAKKAEEYALWKVRNPEEYALWKAFHPESVEPAIPWGRVLAKVLTAIICVIMFCSLLLTAIALIIVVITKIVAYF